MRNLMDKGYWGPRRSKTTRVILPIASAQLSEEEKSYNNCHSSIRIYVEKYTQDQGVPHHGRQVP